MYTAIITRNFRDVRTTTPKVLLLNIIDEDGQTFRDHCWVTITDILEKFIPLKNHIKNIITFDAKITDYRTINHTKQTLSSFENIYLLKHIKKASCSN